MLAMLALTAAAVLVRGRLHWDGVLIDLEVYRMGGQAVIDGDDLYDLQYFIGGLGFTYTPFSAVVFAPFALLSTFGAAALWTALSMLALARSCWLLARAAPDAVPRSWSVTEAALLFFAAAFLLEPVVATFGFGQVNLIIMWAVLEDVLRPRPSLLGGVLIGVAAGVKIIPGVFALYLLTLRRYADGLRALAVAAGTVVVGFIVLPASSWEYWTGIAYDSDRVGGVDFVSNQSFAGLLHRIFDDGATTIGWVVSAVALTAGLLLGRRLWQLDLWLLSLTTMAMSALLASPISWSHHWVWFLPSLVALADQARRRPGATDWVAVGLAAAIVAVTLQPVHDETYSVIWQVAYQREWAGWEWLAANAYLIVALALLGYAWWATAPALRTRVGHAELVVLGDDDLVG